MSSSARASASRRPNAKPSAPASSRLPHARPGSGRAVPRKMARRSAPGPKQPDRVLRGARASHARVRLAPCGRPAAAGGGTSPGAAWRAVCGAQPRGGRSRNAWWRNARSRNARWPNAWLRNACDAWSFAWAAAARARLARVVSEWRGLLRLHKGCCADARRRAYPAERRKSRPSQRAHRSRLHPCRCLRAPPGSTTLRLQRRQSRRPEYSAERATEAGAHAGTKMRGFESMQDEVSKEPGRAPHAPAVPVAHRTPSAPSSSRMFAAYLADIERLLDAQRREVALREALDLPSIAVALADPRLSSSRERAMSWCQECIRPPGAERDAQGLDYEHRARNVTEGVAQATEPDGVPMR